MTLEEFKADSDWRRAFYEASGGSLSSAQRSAEDPGLIDKVTEIIASVEGGSAGPDWVALVKLADGRYVKVVARAATAARRE